jgi:hypothetical protein
MSFTQTLMHYKFGHHRMGGRFFRNHINFQSSLDQASGHRSGVLALSS